MISILQTQAQFSKMYYIRKSNTMRMFSNLQRYTDFSKETSRTNTTNILAYSNSKGRANYSRNYHHSHINDATKLFAKLQHHVDFSNQSRYTHTDNAIEMFSELQSHTDFSKKLNFTDKEMKQLISDLASEWLRRFDSLGDVEANIVSGTLNTLSKLDIFNKMWNRADQTSFKRLIFRLSQEGDKLLDPKLETGCKFTPWQICNCLNALSKWNVMKSNEWESSKILLFKSFIGKLINQGNWLLDPSNKTSDNFNSVSVTNILNALSKWNLEEFPESRQFIVRLMKQSNDKFTSLSVVKTLNAMSKWHLEELQGAKEFICQLMKQGTAMADKLNSLEVAITLNALSKWNVEELQAKGFIIRLVNRGFSIVDEFNCQDIANCMNALSKWNIEELQGAKQFVIRLVKKGSGITGRFKPQAISNCLNAVSKWNIDELPGTREFIVQLAKCGNLTVYKFTSMEISTCLNALSKWNVDEFENAKEFINQLVKQGITTIDRFNSQSIANSLNALSKWNVDELEGAREFIACLLKRGILTIDGFSSQAISNSLNALSKWNIDEFQKADRFIVELVKQGNTKAVNFNPQEIAGSLNALRKFSIFNNDKWNNAELGNFKNFVIKLAKKGERIYKEFDSQNVANIFNAFWKLDIFNDEKWSENEQILLKTFIVNLSSFDKPYENHTLESVSCIYSALLDWDIFHKHKFDSSAMKEFERLSNNLKRRVLTIAERRDLIEPEVDIRFSTQIVKNLSQLDSKSLMLFDVQILRALMQCFTSSVENCNASQLMDSWTQQNILSCLQELIKLAQESKDRSVLDGLFDENLFNIHNHLLRFDINYADRVLQSINEIDELGIITDSEMLKKLRRPRRYGV